jgi:LuxR family transcriptional regulator, maltose regulon positive regulatory protein
LLLYELKSSRPELVPGLHGRASSWYEGAKFLEEAIRHAIAAADHERTGLLIARHWYRYLLAGRTATVEQWLDALPQELVNTDAALILAKAWIAATYGRGEERARYLALAEGTSHEGRLPDGTPSVESGVSIIRSVFAYGGIQSSLEAGDRAEPLRRSQHGENPSQIHLPQARGLLAQGCRRGSPRQRAHLASPANPHIP